MSRQEEILAIREEMRGHAEAFAATVRKLQAITGDGYGSITVILRGTKRMDGSESKVDYASVNNSPGSGLYISEVRFGNGEWDSTIDKEERR